MAKKPIVKRPPKTIKEKKFVKAYLETGDHNEAAELVYDVSSRAAARVIAQENLRKLTMGDEFDKVGLTNSFLAQHAAEGIMATKVIAANIKYGDADEQTNDFIDVPDWQSRHKYFNSIVQLKGLVPKEDNNVVNNNFVIVRASDPTS